MDILISSLKKINLVIRRIEEIFCIFSIGFLVIVTGYGAFSRYILRTPLQWPMEYGMFVYLWLAFISASLVLKDQGHYKISVLFDKFSPTIQKIVKIITDLIILIFLGVLLHGSIAVLPTHYLRPMTLTINKAYHTLAISFGFGFMMLYILQSLLETIDNLINGNKEKIESKGDALI